jgi:hypothetical protein
MTFNFEYFEIIPFLFRSEELEILIIYFKNTIIGVFRCDVRKTRTNFQEDKVNFSNVQTH